MKKLFCFIFMCLVCEICQAQNLVPNGDFEGYSSCPNAVTQLNHALYWMNPAGGTPDYFNQCATIGSDVSVPLNFYGHQNANSGVAYCGIVGFRNPNYPTWREYIEVQLTSSLNAGQCYHLEMYISLAGNSGFTSDAIGAYFSNVAVTGWAGTSQLPYIPQIDINLGLNTDTLNWLLITGNFVASGGENFMLIGNFKSDAQTNSLAMGGNLIYSFFYIDDVSLTPCTGIDENDTNSAITISPNPFSDILNVTSYSNEPAEFVLYDIIGSIVLRQTFINEVSINTEQLRKGVYVYKVIANDRIVKQRKVVKN